MAVRQTDVHTKHCCLQHGCKYGDEDCSVVRKKHRRKQSNPCEMCREMRDDFRHRLAEVLELRMPWTDESIIDAVRDLQDKLEAAWEAEAGENL
jgi:cytidine deaminase